MADQPQHIGPNAPAFPAKTAPPPNRALRWITRPLAAILACPIRAIAPRRPSVLNDASILHYIAEGKISITPLDPQDVQPASVDLHLDHHIRVFRTDVSGAVIDVRSDNTHLLTDEEIPENGPFLLQARSFALAQTNESMALAPDVVARLDGKSSLGRLGLLVHATAGFIDPGFHGTITLELSNATTIPITLYRDMKIAQVSFIDLKAPATRPYGSPGLGSKYQGQTLPTPSRVYQEDTIQPARSNP